MQTPYGGTLVDLVATGEERDELAAHASSLPSLTLSRRSLFDLELLANGAFSPLRGFLGRADYHSVLERMRLQDGMLWPMPITLPVAGGERHLGRELALRNEHNQVLAVLAVEEAFPLDPAEEAQAVLGTTDARHPLVAEMARWGRVALSGRLRVLALPRPADFAHLRGTPREVRAALEALGLPAVVAFQTRNPMHRAHEELTRRAAERCSGALLIHPVVGVTRPGDVDQHARVLCYERLVQRYYDPARTLLRLLPLAMRMAGPREALWHALIRRNFGATHFIVGRDHAGPGQDSQGKPFYGPYDAQQLCRRHAGEMGMGILPFQEMAYLPDEDRYEEVDRIPAGARTWTISGTQVRTEYLDRDRPLPEWFTRPEIAAILAELARLRRGFCVWLTGLPSAGKTATANALTTLLVERGRPVTLLDGDVVRTHLSKGLGFSREDRDTNVRRIAFVAGEVVRHGGAAICAAVSPYRATREECRELIGADRFVEVFVDTPLAVCEQRDEKGLYARARRGDVQGVTGIDDPYEPPPAPEIRLDTVEATVEANARAVLDYLAGRRFLAPAGGPAS